MARYITIRLLQSLLILLVLSFGIYGLLNFMPGDPVSMLAATDPRIKKEDVERIRKQRGLDKHWIIRYGIWLKDVAKGDLGYSDRAKRPTGEVIADKLRNTVRLTATSFLLSLLIAIPVGILCAVKQYSWIDYSANFFAFIGISIPTFWFGQMMILIFAEKLRWLPAGGLQSPEGSDMVDKIRHLLMPAIVLGVASMGGWVRYVRAQMLEVIRSDYIRTARAKGLDEETVILKHAFRNALIPIVTLLALSLPFLFSGAMITETVFSYPGMGLLMLDSIISKDYYVAMVALLTLAALTMFCNFLADVAYAAVDPRIRAS